jgi:hypothetical protein
LTYRFLESYMTTVFKLLVGLFTLAFTLLGFAGKVLVFGLDVLAGGAEGYDIEQSGYRYEVECDLTVDRTSDGRRIVD